MSLFASPDGSASPIELPPLGQRSDDFTLKRQKEMFTSSLPAALLDTVLSFVLVLNKTRQIIYANKNFLDFLGIDDPADIVGKRPGEALGCEGATEGHLGCGTAERCLRCGALTAIVEGFRKGEATHEVRISRHGPEGLEAFDFRVSATRLYLDDEEFLVFAVEDISNEKRRRILERIFFHDLMNTVGGLRNLVEYLTDELPDEHRKLALMIHDVFKNMVDEIETQKLLLAAETGDLHANYLPVITRDLLLSVKKGLENHDVAMDKEIRLDEDSAVVSMITDDSLVRRVLVNMLKNALEAEPGGNTVTMGCTYDEAAEAVVFRVHNPTAMSSDVKLQIFQRSFSTKGLDRGIGTYSIKLLAERYLGGTVWFTSTPGEGTTFYARWPRRPVATAGE
ncbi:PAS domain-containing sensor histidine kinase [Oceanidesulfovibrio marinus]|uniref:histidine kinase n=1 Tax=Oceanidesulfovibrio marinus TaxID=370038 RepID=A0A6P1ZGG1_9BACT|nr:PAS domain-containing sensor histidine kinase [Oceanidesulfovibrio marinus]TVM34094.1 sensor histidine kinase [Oceanidesulfovibrio marinus]